MFKRKKIRFVDVDEMRELLAYAKKFRYIIFGEPESPLSYYAFIEDTMTRVKLTMFYKGEGCTYVFRKDLLDSMEEITGLDAYQQLTKDYSRRMGHTVPFFEDEFGSARAILAFKNEYNFRRVNAICYDQNSAYALAMMKPMPRTEELAGRDRPVRDGEIGFANVEMREIKGWTMNTDQCLQMILPGEGYASYIFPSMDSPFTAFAQRWFVRKLESQDPKLRHKAKQMLVFSIGYLQRKNPFLRAAVVEYANRMILDVADENTIYINTDSITSLTERTLPMGENLGQFKIEHEGEFAHVGFNYQWNTDKPAYRGIPKEWFPDGWDILKHQLPSNGNIYEFDRTTLEIYDHTKEIQNEIKDKESNELI